MKTPLIRLPFDHAPHAGLICPEETLTKQSFLEECDYNNILAKWQNSGLITHLNAATPIYADVSDVSDYQQSLELIRSAQASFDALSSSIRDRFNNDPAALLRFIQDPNNYPEALRMGLVSPRPEAAAERPHKAGGDAASETPSSGV